jgi:hypothetical protein
VARDAGIAERTATKLTIEVRQAADLAAAHAAEAAACEAALKAEQEARDTEFAARITREATSVSLRLADYAPALAGIGHTVIPARRVKRRTGEALFQSGCRSDTQSASSLQVRPSRSISAIAEDGPQLPAG